MPTPRAPSKAATSALMRDLARCTSLEALRTTLGTTPLNTPVPVAKGADATQVRTLGEALLTHRLNTVPWLTAGGMAWGTARWPVALMRTPINTAADYAQWQAKVADLVAVGWSPSDHSKAHGTLFHMSATAMHFDPRACTYLLDFGADPTLTDALGRTALHVFVEQVDLLRFDALDASMQFGGLGLPSELMAQLQMGSDQAKAVLGHSDAPAANATEYQSLVRGQLDALMAHGCDPWTPDGRGLSAMDLVRSDLMRLRGAFYAAFPEEEATGLLPYHLLAPERLTRLAEGYVPTARDLLTYLEAKTGKPYLNHTPLAEVIQSIKDDPTLAPPTVRGTGQRTSRRH